MSAADRMPRWQLSRQRSRQGLIGLRTWHDEAHITALLKDYLEPNLADDKQAIERALERYIAAGRAAEFDV
jgi:hypothetical protein